jgi:hypothetical protein
MMRWVTPHPQPYPRVSDKTGTFATHYAGSSSKIPIQKADISFLKQTACGYTIKKGALF